MRTTLTLTLLVLLSACSGRPPEAEPPGDALLDLWTAVPVGMNEVATADASIVCADPFGTWFEDFGVRGLACGANQGVALATAASRAPTRIWTSGPHQLDADGLALDLTAEQDFGRYNPEFVEWAVANVVPRTESARRIAQPVYDRYVQRLARAYWLALKDLEADGFPESLPPGPASDYAAYLEGGPFPGDPAYGGGISTYGLFGDMSEPIADRLTQPGGNIYMPLYETSTAFGFWVRRQVDGTAETFADGLSDLMQALDAEWLATSAG
ncbi:MAG: hypothetical protein Rubg2KO_37250 [Rubricoccaceae bacterium]